MKRKTSSYLTHPRNYFFAENVLSKFEQHQSNKLRSRSVDDKNRTPTLPILPIFELFVRENLYVDVDHVARRTHDTGSRMGRLTNLHLHLSVKIGVHLWQNAFARICRFTAPTQPTVLNLWSDAITKVNSPLKTGAVKTAQPQIHTDFHR
jgi:hypothetical protein